MKFRELCTKEIVQLSNGACLGRADDLELDPATAQVKSLLLLGQPHLFGLLGRDETLVIPWTDIETLGVDALQIRPELTEPEIFREFSCIRVRFNKKSDYNREP